jgi:phage gpG-like protein
MSLSIRDTLSPAMQRLLRKVRDKRPVLEAAGATMAGLTVQAFRNASIRPKEWDELAESTLKRKGGKGNVLIDSGALWQSIVSDPGSSQVEIGTDRFYAPYLQFGTSRMPARPFIPVTDDDELTPLASRRVGDAVERVLRRAAR